MKHWFVEVPEYNHILSHTGFDTFEIEHLVQRLRGTRFASHGVVRIPLAYLFHPQEIERILEETRFPDRVLSVYSHKIHSQVRIRQSTLHLVSEDIYREFRHKYPFDDKMYMQYYDRGYMGGTLTTNTSSMSAMAPVNYTGKYVPPQEEKKEVKKEETEKLVDSLFKVQMIKLKQED